MQPSTLDTESLQVASISERTTIRNDTKFVDRLLEVSLEALRETLPPELLVRLVLRTRAVCGPGAHP
jgi:hypothetical protein